jgi:ribokinase
MFIGHVSIDRVENQHGTKIQPGGAALYATIAARTLLKAVAMVSAVGKDYEFRGTLDSAGSDYVKSFNMPSTRFTIRYDKLGEADYLEASHGAGSQITASLVPSRILGPKTIVHISPMRLRKVKSIVRKIRKDSPETQISINTWIGYINEGRRARSTLKTLASEADYFIVNDMEAKALTQTDSISTALSVLEAKTLIITLGQLGAIIKGNTIGIQMVPALNYPVKKVVDTTGAGDTWCGAFLATYKLTKDLMKSVTVASVISSIKCSGWGLEKLLNRQFRKPDDVIEYVIGLKEGALQKRILDYARQ